VPGEDTRAELLEPFGGVQELISAVPPVAELESGLPVNAVPDEPAGERSRRCRQRRPLAAGTLADATAEQPPHALQPTPRVPRRRGHHFSAAILLPPANQFKP
jgi:hypothetical protein